MSTVIWNIDEDGFYLIESVAHFKQLKGYGDTSFGELAGTPPSANRSKPEWWGDGVKYRQTVDLDFGGAWEWPGSLGDDTSHHSGGSWTWRAHYDGGGHKLSNITFGSTQQGGKIGLFRATEASSVIENLVLDGVWSITDTYMMGSARGFLCGYNKGTIRNVRMNFSDGSIIVGGDYVGALCGQSEGGKIYGISVDGTLTMRAGGNVAPVIGRASGTELHVIKTESTLHVTFDGNMGGNSGLGGIVGYLGVNNTHSNMIARATLTIVNQVRSFGGIWGYSSGSGTSNFTNVLNAQTITGDGVNGNQFLGGMMGYNGGSGGKTTFTRCINRMTGNITSNRASGWMPISYSEIEFVDCYVKYAGNLSSPSADQPASLLIEYRGPNFVATASNCFLDNAEMLVEGVQPTSDPDGWFAFADVSATMPSFGDTSKYWFENDILVFSGTRAYVSDEPRVYNIYIDYDANVIAWRQDQDGFYLIESMDHLMQVIRYGETSWGTIVGAPPSASRTKSEWWGAKYRQTLDLDFQDVLINNDYSMGGGDKRYDTWTGHYDGQGHKLSNVTLGQQGKHIGFFRYAKATSIIENLVLDGTWNLTDMHMADAYRGFLCGYNLGTIRNISTNFAEGSIIKGPDYLGTIVGQSDGKVYGITLDGSVTIEGGNKGSLAGMCKGEVHAIKTMPSFHMTCDNLTGGIIGVASSTNQSNIVALGTITCTGGMQGGIWGQVAAGALSTFTDVYNGQTITYQNDSTWVIGGMTGYHSASQATNLVRYKRCINAMTGDIRGKFAAGFGPIIYHPVEFVDCYIRMNGNIVCTNTSSGQSALVTWGAEGSNFSMSATTCFVDPANTLLDGVQPTSDEYFQFRNLSEMPGFSDSSKFWFDGDILALRPAAYESDEPKKYRMYVNGPPPPIMADASPFSAAISWDPEPGATRYRVSMKKLGAYRFSQLKSQVETQKLLKNLDPSTEYEFLVEARVDGEWKSIAMGSVTTKDFSPENISKASFKASDGTMNLEGLDTSSLNAVKENLNEIFSTGDELVIDVGGTASKKKKKKATMVKRGEAVPLEKDVEALVIPFDSEAGDGQEIQMELENDVTVSVAYDANTNAIEVGGETLNVGDSTIVGGLLMTVLNF